MPTWRNTSETFGWVQIVLHWLMAVVIFGLFALGLYMVNLEYYDPWYHRAPYIHKSIAILLACVFILRVVWRVTNGVPKGLVSSVWQQRAASTVHLVFYFLLPVVFLSGYFISTADGHGISVFGWFEVPALVLGIDNQEDIAGEVHELAAWILIILAIGHSFFALKHHFVDRNNTLKRILKPLS